MKIADRTTTDLPQHVLDAIAAATTLDDLRHLKTGALLVHERDADRGDLIHFRCFSLGEDRRFWEAPDEWKRASYTPRPDITIETCAGPWPLAQALGDDLVTEDQLEQYATEIAEIRRVTDSNCALRRAYEDAKILDAIRLAVAGMDDSLVLEYRRPDTKDEIEAGLIERDLGYLRKMGLQLQADAPRTIETVKRVVNDVLDDPRRVLVQMYARLGMERLSWPSDPDPWLPSAFLHWYEDFEDAYGALALYHRHGIVHRDLSKDLAWLAGAEGWAAVAEYRKETAGGDRTRPQAAIDRLVAWTPMQEVPEASAPVLWLLEPWLQRGLVGTFVSPGGTGKTSVALDLAISVAAGEPWHGCRVNTRLKKHWPYKYENGEELVTEFPPPPQDDGESHPAEVLYLSLDDNQADLDAALADLLRSRCFDERTLETVLGNLRVISLQGLVDGPLVDPETGKPTIFADQLRHYVSLMPRCRFIVLDTLRQFSQADSKDERVMGGLLRVAGTLTTVPTNPTAMINHHTTKQGARDRQVDQYAGSGSGTLADSARFVLYLDKLSADEVKALLEKVYPDPMERGLFAQDTYLQLSSERGSLRVKTPDPMLIVREDAGTFNRVDASKPTKEEVAEVKLAGLEQEVLDAVTKLGRGSKRDIHGEVGGNQTEVYDAIRALVRSGRLQESAQKRSGHPLIELPDCVQANGRE